MRLAVVRLRDGLALAGVLLAVCPRAFALNPSLDVSQYAHTSWKVRDGFTKGTIGSIAQTPDGYLWLGTEFGLYRFDGVRAVPWQPPPNQHLPSNNAMRLLVARDGTLWIGTYDGLASWKSGRLTHYPELARHYIFAIVEDHEGTIWASGVTATIGKLCAIQHGNVQCFGEDGSLGKGAFNLFVDSKGNLWAGVKDGLWRWKPGPPRFYPLPGEQNGIQGLAEDADGTLLIGWKGGIEKFVEGRTSPYTRPRTVPAFRTHRMLRDRDGGVWIATSDHGLIHVHEGRTDVFTQADGLSGDDVLGLFQDREGSIWAAGINGLDRFRDFAAGTFTTKQGLSSNEVGSVLAAKDGSVWLGTYGGLNQWKDGKITTSRARKGKPDGELNGQVPESLFQDARGRLWVSTFHEFGYMEQEHFVSLARFHIADVLSIVEDKSGDLWVDQEHEGLFQVSHGSVVERFTWASLGHKDHISVLAADSVEGGLWLGFHNGGVAYFKDGQVRAAYAAADGLGTGRVDDFRVEPDGTLWASTEGGLSLIRNGRVATLNSKNGLPCDAVHWSIKEGGDSVWLYTACGLLRIARPELDAWAAAADKDAAAKAALNPTVFDNSDGVRILSGTGHYHPQVAKSADGKIWFLPWDGVSVVDPSHLPFNKLPPPVHIEQITADRKTYDPVSYANGNVPLPARVRDLEIDYTALSLVVPEKVLFRYKLEGLDSDWQEAGNRRQAFYTNLPPRRYRFRVMACNNSGVWNEAGAFLDFSVAPAYYQTWWFRLALVGAFLVLLWAGYQLRLQQLAYEYDIRVEERVGERTRIARELHDSLLQGFQGLMFRLQAVRDMFPGPREALQALDVALERGDKAIAEARDAVSDMRQSAVGDSDIAKALTALGEELAAQSDNGRVPCVRVLVEGKQRELNPVLRDQVYSIGREAMRNAFRHARAQKIEAEIAYGDSEFVFHVRDDGIGLAPAVAEQRARPGHWGLPGMRERAKNFGGRLEVWSEGGAGTEIKLIVPAAVAYGKTNARRRFWILPRKTDGTVAKQS